MINTKFNQIVEMAKAKAANSPAWQRCLDKAAKMLASGELAATVLADGVLVTSPNGSYKVTAGHCPCAARTPHCYHRCAARIASLLEENALAEAAAARCDVIIADIKEIAETLATTSDKPATRNEIIAEITNMWPRTWPPLATELMARFRVNSLNFLADDMLKAVRLAIAM